MKNWLIFIIIQTFGELLLLLFINIIIINFISIIIIIDIIIILSVTRDDKSMNLVVNKGLIEILQWCTFGYILRGLNSWGFNIESDLSEDCLFSGKNYSNAGVLILFI